MGELLTLGPLNARHHLLLAHGAGAPMTSPFLEVIAEMLASRGVCVHRFEFAFMAARRDGAPRRPPPKAELLVEPYRQAVHQWISSTPRHGAKGACQRLFIGGKSLGGRVASLVAEDEYAAGQVAGLVCLGYPFHPPGQPNKLRTAHLEHMTCPALVVQGTCDPFGTRADVTGYTLSERIRFHWIEDGNHDLRPPLRSGRTQDAALQSASDAINTFMCGMPHA